MSWRILAAILLAFAIALAIQTARAEEIDAGVSDPSYERSDGTESRNTKTDIDTAPRANNRDYTSTDAVYVRSLTDRFMPSARGGARWTAADTLALVREVFPPGEVARAVRVVACESSNRPDAVSAGWDRRYGWYSYRGLLQVEQTIHGDRMRRLFGASASLFDPVVNIGTAAAIHAESGWQPWPNCGRR